MNTEIAKRVCTKCDTEKDLLKDFSYCPKNKQLKKTICRDCLQKYRDERKERIEEERNRYY